jgi:protease I
MTNELQGKRVAFLVANEGVEEIELTEPWNAVRDAGGEPRLISPESGYVHAFNHLDKGDRFEVELTTAEVDPDAYDALVLPGGVANPDQLRTDDGSVKFIRQMLDDGKPVAAICHAPWTLIEAGVVEGRTLTSWPSLRTDLENAGARWVDEEVRVDGNLITSRNPDDLPAFCTTIVREFAAAS